MAISSATRCSRTLSGRVIENIRTMISSPVTVAKSSASYSRRPPSKGAEILALRIKNAITAKPFEYAQHTINYSASIGLTVYRPLNVR